MEALNIPKQEQLKAILSDSVLALAERYVENPSPYNLKRYLTINRAELIDYLRLHPEETQRYFDAQQSSQATHDVLRVWIENNHYLVGYMDHGSPADVTAFDDLPEALAEFILCSYGMY
jgi:hypothetical protein